MTDTWGGSWGTSWGVSWAKEITTATGGFLHPYIALKEKETARRRLEKARLELQKAEEKKKELSEAIEIDGQEKELTQRLARQEREIARLAALLQTLEALIEQWDEEDALIVLLMSGPF